MLLLRRNGQIGTGLPFAVPQRKTRRRGEVSHPPSTAEGQPSETTMLLRAWAGGDQKALEQLTPRVYRTLRRIAGHHMKSERRGDSLQATALVHEAYLKLIDIT